ncbi:carbon-nitrogen hydrolase family protein [Streptomonospora wellingtoniae]|uniref:Carbon-nitrogen hydrolase family protein n=1 Tax=Streptomonospora wellingtoniae TaxID=3075544 RepID=A0ABU2KZA8_9ACTN|nr:carbon-nitrogen hydrolase family protein [Streptomonospora sp. DSM 45055]MDT0304640.1 carbon-nitrogen hydrolase family protein [Streptomonospora sp. DSM 45055]
MVHVAVAQFAPGEDKTQNLAAAGRLVAEAAERGAGVVLLPEYAMFTAPRTDRRFVKAAEPLDGAFVSGLARLAAESGAVVVAGINEAVPGGERFRNTLVALEPGGSVAALYRKLHLYDAFGATESDVVEPGAIDAPQTFSRDGVVFGLQTCYDLRFPEVTRRIADAGAQVLLLAAEWVPGPQKEDHWDTLVRARAIENTLYVAAAGQNAPTGAGNSMVVDPMGVRVVALGEQTGVAVAPISTDRLTQVRTKNPALRLRRFTVTPA